MTWVSTLFNLILLVKAQEGKKLKKKFLKMLTVQMIRN